MRVLRRHVDLQQLLLGLERLGALLQQRNESESKNVARVRATARLGPRARLLSSGVHERNEEEEEEEEVQVEDAPAAGIGRWSSTCSSTR